MQCRYLASLEQGDVYGFAAGDHKSRKGNSSPGDDADQGDPGPVIVRLANRALPPVMCEVAVSLRG
jgi:hypothetical protein